MNPLASPQPEMKDYAIADRLGSGTFATVFRGYRKSGAHKGEPVAVKCIERKNVKSKRAMENLLTEIKVMKELRHQFIVRLIDFEWNERHIYLILEYCGGGDLSHFIRSRKALPEDSARKFVRQLALALHFMRSKGVSHMDLKPQNLLLTDNKRSPVLKVGDFGMAQHLYSGDTAHSFRGSPLYMAPEVLMGQPYDAKVDLWSVGVILYEALFGMAPFHSSTIEELEEKVLDDKPVEMPDSTQVSEECGDLLHRLLQKEASNRMSFEEFFSHPFIDVEHYPSAECLPKARELIQQAVDNDSKHNINAAITLYCQALEYFIPAMQFETDHATREALKQRIEQYIDRAEYLKGVLRRKKPTHSHPLKLIEEMQASNPKLKAALTKARLADQLETHGSYKKALQLYKDAVAILIPLIDEAESREEKIIIKSEAEVYLKRAEEVATLAEQPTPKLRRFRSGDADGSKSCKVQ